MFTSLAVRWDWTSWPSGGSKGSKEISRQRTSWCTSLWSTN